MPGVAPPGWGEGLGGAASQLGEDLALIALGGLPDVQLPVARL